jgi:uncharacterized protein (TIGR03083 family)
MQLTPRYGLAPVIVIDGPVDGQLAPASRQRRRLAALLSSLSDEQLRAASRCDGWTVTDVAAHLVGVNAFWHGSVAAGIAGRPTRVLAGFDPARTPALMVDGMRSLAPAEIVEHLVATNETFLDAISNLDQEGWAAPAESPAGHVPIHLVLQHALWDCWVHERDILLPLGATQSCEPDEIVSCLRYAAAVSAAFAITAGTAIPGTLGVEASDPGVCFWLEVGDRVDVHEGTPPNDSPCLRGQAIDLIEALSMREPIPASAPPEWQSLLLAGLATVFDQAGSPAE